MASSDGDDLRERVAHLEQTVAELKDTVAALQADASESAGSHQPSSRASGDQQTGDQPIRDQRIADPPSPSADTPPRPSATDRLIKRIDATIGLRSEDWLSRVGIALLLFGVAFLFKYSIDEGWLIPEVRVGFGVALGTGLAAAGLRLYDERRRLRQILLGGSSATFYATVFAAVQLYALLPYSVAFASMVTITICTIALAIRQDEALLAVIGTLGGLGTPFLLPTEADGLLGLSVYLTLMLSGATAIFLYRGWRTLLGATVAGGWLVLLVTALRVAFASGTPEHEWALQGAISSAWLMLGGAPVIRPLLRRHAPERWPPPPDVGRDWLRRLTEGPGRYTLVGVSPYLALLSSRLLWDASGAVWTSVAGVGALLYAGAYAELQRRSLPRYAAAHGLVAAVLTAYGLSEAAGGETLLVAWTVEAGLLLLLARQFKEPSLRGAGHVLFSLVACWLAIRLSEPDRAATPLINPGALSDLFVLGAGLGGAVLQRSALMGRLYAVLVLAGWLAWWPSELAAVGNGPAYVSAAWCATAAALLVMGTWRRTQLIQMAGLATLALFVGKLFLVDLASLPALGRILLFLGSGALFLLISYSLPGLLPSDDEPPPED